MSDFLSLLDWRRRTDAAFAAARAASDPAAGHASWRATRDDLFAHHPQSPLPEGDRLRGTGLPYFAYDPAYRFSIDVVPVKDAEQEEASAVAGEDDTLRMRRIGRVDLPDPVDASLDVWWLQQYAGGIFVPLRDATAGQETYGGRYVLDTTKGAWHGGHGAAIVLDLNFAYHPSCRYDPAWQCPLAPAGNTIGSRVPVGERLG